MRYLPAGTKLRHYLIQDVLGSGGFGVTYLARDDSGELVAIKEYFPEEFALREDVSVRARTGKAEDFNWGRQRFFDEADTLALFKHDNIVRVIQRFEENDTGYLVLAYESGRDLKAWLAEIEDVPSQAELDLIVGPVLDALEVVHRNDLRHYDVAPDNIYIRDNGTPVLIDFGSAREAVAQHTKSISAVVKPGYSPPELYSTSGRARGPWSDIYALAATLYRAMTGRAPQEATDRVLVDENVPVREAAKGKYRPAFLDAVDWGLKLVPRDRPQSIAEWREKLLSREMAEGAASAGVAGRPWATAASPLATAPDFPLLKDKAKVVLPPQSPTTAPAPAWFYALFLGSLAVPSALLSTYSGLDPWDVVALPLRAQGNFAPQNPPLLPAIYFGIVLCTAMYLWSSRSPRPLAIVFGSVLAGWVAAHETAVFGPVAIVLNALGVEVDKSVTFALTGLVAGVVGATIVVLGIHLAAPDTSRKSMLRTSAVGGLAGLLLFIDDTNLLLFLVWQPAVAACVGYSLGGKARAGNESVPSARVIMPHQAIAVMIIWIVLGGVGVLIRQGVDLATAEFQSFADAGGIDTSKRDVAKLRAYLDGCKICKKKAEAKAALDDEQAFANAGNDIGALQAYVNGCGDKCVHISEANGRIDSLKQSAAAAAATKAQDAANLAATNAQTAREAEQYRAARGDIDRLRTYLRQCSICAYKSDANGEIDRLGREIQQANTEADRQRYLAASGNIDLLRAYVTDCTVCTYRTQAYNDISRIEEENRRVEFTLTNNSSGPLYVTLHDGMSRVQLDPMQGNVYTLGKGETRTYQLSCTPGQSVCYGAAKPGNNLSPYWGVSNTGKQDCANCCVTCPGTSGVQVLNSSQARVPPPTVTWRINDNTYSLLSIAFYSQTRSGHTWPGANMNWPLNKGQNNFTISCMAGEKICWGAWLRDNIDGTYWGVGPYSRYGCQRCCRTCDGGAYEENLTQEME